MSATNQSQNPIEARIARLEQQNRRWKQGAFVCVLAVSAVALMGQTQTSPGPKKTTKKPAPASPAPPAAPVIPDRLEAQSFVLVDAAGKSRAELAVGGTGPSFRLLNPAGSAEVTISLNDNAPGGPVVLLSDPDHKAGLTMSVLAGAGSQLSLHGENADAQVHLGVTKDGTAVELFDPDGFSTSLGNGTKVNKSGKAQQTTAASITLYNKDRKVLWAAP
jgi:hypothetical protein